MTINLRDSLLAALASLPGTREFHLHVLISSPRKNTTLFRFARPRPKVYLQDVLVLLSEQASPDAPRIIVAAIEAGIYNIPATSCALLYVSKVDTTGQSKAPSPTSTLVRAFLAFFADPATRPLVTDHLWIQLFARAQAQYLFPNSAEYAGKRPLNDIKLCAWWKCVLTDVARDIDAKKENKAITKLYYILPGFNELEALNSLRIVSSSAASTGVDISWNYGHPYSQHEIPLPCPADNSNEGIKNLGHIIPYFDDDPKSRFLDEIAYTTDGDGLKSPVRKRSRTNSHSEGVLFKEKEVADEKTSKNGKDDRPIGELGKVSADEFWERMSFRQECVAGAVTGFFTLMLSTSTLSKDNNVRSSPSPLAPQPGQVSSQINKRIMSSLLTGVEFSTVERSVKATETLESAIKGLCEGISPVLPVSAQAPPARRDFGRQTPEPETRPALLAPPVTPPRQKAGKAPMPEISPNPFPEPETSLETYNSHIYGSVSVSNPDLTVNTSSSLPKSKEEATGSAPQVTVLAVRKKKRAT